MTSHGHFWLVMWGWDGGGGRPRPHTSYTHICGRRSVATHTHRCGRSVTTRIITLLMIAALWCISPGSAQDDTTVMASSLPTTTYPNTTLAGFPDGPTTVSTPEPKCHLSNTWPPVD
ncbi:hypothetical protein OTU49_015702, partial [Cherax quadricarinatus]